MNNASFLYISTGTVIPYNPYQQQVSQNTSTYYEKIKAKVQKKKKDSEDSKKTN